MIRDVLKYAASMRVCHVQQQAKPVTGTSCQNAEDDDTDGMGWQSRPAV
jgi:hypothetical protein